MLIADLNFENSQEIHDSHLDKKLKNRQENMVME